MDKKQLALLVIAVVCVGVCVYRYYGNRIDKDNDYLKTIPALAGGLYALNFVLSLATQ
jgi:uncharacterized protein YxeA